MGSSCQPQMTPNPNNGVIHSIANTMVNDDNQRNHIRRSREVENLMPLFIKTQRRADGFAVPTSSKMAPSSNHGVIHNVANTKVNDENRRNHIRRSREVENLMPLFIKTQRPADGFAVPTSSKMAPSSNHGVIHNVDNTTVDDENLRHYRPVAVTLTLPDCPVCMETMRAPIYQCQSGHSLCDTCTKTLMPPICPICRQAMTQIRNRQLEDMIATAKMPCPNKSSGCVYIIATMDVEDHLKECIFRKMDCPHGAVFGRCSWNGKLNEMMNHFKECHPKECNVRSDSDVVVNVNLNEDYRHMYLTAKAKLHFIITMKIDTQQKMAYWTIQHIGGKADAHQHIYEIHITSIKDPRRKMTFTEHCFNDAVKADEVMRQGKCAVLPLDVLKYFVIDRNLAFRFFIKRLPPNQNKDNKLKGPKGPRSRSQGPGTGSKGPGPKSSGPKKYYKPHA